MSKYTLYRSFGYLEKQIKQHELIAVEYGKDIDDVTDALIKAVQSDALCLEKYRRYYTANVYAPKPVESHMRVKRYHYMMDAVLCPDVGEKNDIIEYGVIEEKEREPI